MRTKLNKQQISEILHSITILREIFNQPIFELQDNEHLFEASEFISKAISELYEELDEEN
nr:MAG TPA: hypothetical protein [Caudoviricetes sp.]